MRGVRLRVLIGLAAVLMVAAACGSDSNDAGSGGVDDGGVGLGTGATGATGESGSMYGGGDAGRYGGGTEMTGATGATGSDDAGAKADVSAEVNNYVFLPKTVKVSSGDTLEVRNGNTRTPHTFTVVGEDVDLEIAPLMTESTKIDLEPGTYQLICRFHEQLGMKGKLQVT